MNPQETRNVTEALDDQQQQELLEKFDRESVTAIRSTIGSLVYCCLGNILFVISSLYYF